MARLIFTKEHRGFNTLFAKGKVINASKSVEKILKGLNVAKDYIENEPKKNKKKED